MITYKTSGIYEIRNNLTKDTYIGSAVNLRKRKAQHFSKLNKGIHANKHIQSSFNKYNKENFTFQPLIYCDKSMLILYEQLLIDGIKPQYNINPLAESRLGAKHSIETKRKMSDSKKGQTIPTEQRVKISESEKGKIVSETTKQKIRGENNPSSKLTETDIRWIRNNKNNYSTLELSKKFNVSRKQIYNIKTNKSWKEVSI